MTQTESSESPTRASARAGTAPASYASLPRSLFRTRLPCIEALQRNKDFGNGYRKAFEAFREGIKDVLFPAGTYWLRLFAAAMCEPWPDGGAASPA